MSSDLLKEFGSPEVIPWRVDANQSAANIASVDEDEFGDFEDPSNNGDVTHAQSSLLPSDTVVHPVGSESHWVHSLSADSGYTHSSMTEVRDASSNDDDWGEFSQQSVMFDADVEATRQKKEAERILAEQHRNQEHVNVLLHPTATSTEAFIPTFPVSAVTRANDGQRSPKATKARLQSSKDASKHRVEATEATNFEQATMHDEPWMEFETAEATEAEGPGPKSSNAPYFHTLKKAAETSNLGPPPTNIPPPSILLPLIATTIASLATELKTIQSRQPLDQPSTVSAIGASLSALRAAARILAGRKLRWKRDALLAQSMKIGPAHSGKAGGMKLAGVDRAESRREDQEAAEALQVWRQQAGALRSTVAAFNGRLPEGERFRMPDIANGVPIRQGKASEGTVTAAKCCFLCGVKRDERVAKVDVEVEDSFGEWWVEHWGHIDCVAFWENHKDFLRQR